MATDTEEVTTLGSPAADEQMAKDWDAIREKYTVEEEVSTLPAKETNDAEPAEAKEKPRDEKGKFAKPAKAEPAAKGAPETPALAAAAKPAADAAQFAAEQGADAQTLERDLNRAPSSWKPAAKAAWAALAPEIRAEVLRREGDFLNGQAGLLPDAQFGKELRQVIDPYRMLIEAEGGTPARAVADLMRTAALFRTGTAQQKQAALAQIAQQFGIPLPQSGQIGAEGAQGAQIQQPQQPFLDPRVDTLLARMERQQREQEAVDGARRQSAVSKWENEANAKGEPLRPYVSDVIDDMVAIIPQIRSRNPGAGEHEVLQQAYESATWANPEIRALLQKQSQDELEAKRREDTLRKSAEAKKAASVNLPRRAARTTQAAKGTMEDTIRETWSEIRNRA